MGPSERQSTRRARVGRGKSARRELCGTLLQPHGDLVSASTARCPVGGPKVNTWKVNTWEEEVEQRSHF